VGEEPAAAAVEEEAAAVEAAEAVEEAAPPAGAELRCSGSIGSGKRRVPASARSSGRSG
jgi:hypothetical protein